jgi:hypothetical protein
VAEGEAEILTLAEAAQESGYSGDHLRHLIADGTLDNAGRKGSPRIRRGDLPVKPGHRHQGPTDAEDVAREIIGRIEGRAA